jgi:hypothetical protein
MVGEDQSKGVNFPYACHATYHLRRGSVAETSNLNTK